MLISLPTPTALRIVGMSNTVISRLQKLKIALTKELENEMSSMKEKNTEEK